MDYLKAFYDVQRAVVRVATAAPEPYTDLPHGHVYLLRSKRLDLHPSVEFLLKAGHRPHDLHLLVLETPHAATKPSNLGKIAYVRNEREGMKDVQAVTSVGKYLHRHWPSLPDHVIRDAAQLGEPGKLKILDTMEGIICGIEFGPQSCMKSTYGSIPFDNDANDYLVRYLDGTDDDDSDVPWDHHPYYVYQPEYGWKMAVITIPAGLGEHGPKVETYQARALLLDNDQHKCFVRTYQRPVTPGSYSEASHRLEALLSEVGYRKRDSWPAGAKLAKIVHPTGRYADFMAPYIDGIERYVVECGDHLTITHDGSGYLCDKTDGTPGDLHENMRCCDDCGDEYHEESNEWTYTGRHESHCVCSSCLDHNYVHVEGRSADGRGSYSYYVHEDSAVGVVNEYGRRTGDYVDGEYIPDEYVRVEDGDVCSLDDAVCATDGDWYPRVHRDIVELARECPVSGESYAHKRDAVERDGKWYSDEDDLSDLDDEGTAVAEDEDDEPVATPDPVTTPAPDLTLPANIRAIVGKVQHVSEHAAQHVITLWSEGHPSVRIRTAHNIDDLMVWIDTPQGKDYWGAVWQLGGGDQRILGSNEDMRRIVDTYDAAHPALPTVVTAPEPTPDQAPAPAPTLAGIPASEAPESLLRLAAEVRQFNSEAAQWLLDNWDNKDTMLCMQPTASGLKDVMYWGATPQGATFWYDLDGRVNAARREREPIAA